MRYVTLIFCAFLFLGSVSHANAATYNGVTYTEVFYLCATGNNSNSTDGSCSNAFNRSGFNTSSNWANVDSVDGKIGPNDAVVMLDDGGNFVSLLAQNSGLNGKPIIIMSGIGENPTINQAAAGFGFGGQSYVTLKGPLTISGGSTYALYASSPSIGIVVDGVTINSNQSYGIYWSGASGTIKNIPGGTATLAFLRLQNCPSLMLDGVTYNGTGIGIWFQASASSSITANNLTIRNTSGPAIQVDDANNMSFIGNTWTFTNSNTANTGGGAFYYHGTVSTGVKLQLTNINIITTQNAGVRFANGATFTTDSYINGFDISGATSQGIYSVSATNMLVENGRTHNNGTSGILIDTSPSWTMQNSEFDNNGEDGISMTNNSTNTIVRYNKIHDNGTIHNTGNGDGITAHNGSTGQLYHSNIIYNNWNTGLAVVLDSSGTAYNNTIFNNGGSSDPRGAVYDSGTGGWVIKNNIIFNNNAYYEINFTVASYGASTFDSNQYYHSLNNNFAILGSTISDWTGYHTTLGHEVNAKYGDPLFTNASSNIFNPISSSPAIDAGTNVSLTSDYIGNPIYGTPDIGAYEYQPPHNLVTDDAIDIGAGARIYANGKFRDLASTNSIPAHLKITPSGGSFNFYDAVTTRPVYLDVTNIANWTTSHKTWTESNAQTSNMVTDHTVGDLKNNTFYTINVTGASSSNITGINGTTCSNAVCLSDGSGALSFRYDGGYSTHTFDITEDTTPPTNIGISSITADSSSQLTVTALTATDSISGLNIAPYWFTEISGNIGSSSSTEWQTSNVFMGNNLSCGTQYIYKVKVRDANGNESDFSSPVSTYTSSCIRSGGHPMFISSATPIIKNINSSSNTVATSASIIETNKCEPSKILTQNLKPGARDGVYNSFTKEKVNEVKILQAHMNRLGYGSGREDGILGPVTKGAIMRMQKFLGTTQDGKVGPKTRELINNSCEKVN